MAGIKQEGNESQKRAGVAKRANRHSLREKSTSMWKISSQTKWQRKTKQHPISSLSGDENKKKGKWFPVKQEAEVCLMCPSRSYSVRGVDHSSGPSAAWHCLIYEELFLLTSGVNLRLDALFWHTKATVPFYDDNRILNLYLPPFLTLSSFLICLCGGGLLQCCYLVVLKLNPMLDIEIWTPWRPEQDTVYFFVTFGERVHENQSAGFIHMNIGAQISLPNMPELWKLLWLALWHGLISPLSVVFSLI